MVFVYWMMKPNFKDTIFFLVLSIFIVEMPQLKCIGKKIGEYVFFLRWETLVFYQFTYQIFFFLRDVFIWKAE